MKSNSFVNFFKKIGSYLVNSFKKFYKSESGKALLSSIISILTGLLFGLVAMIVISFINDEVTIEKAFKGLKILMSGPFASKIPAYRKTNIGDTIFYAVPLIMTGLSVGIAYKTGLFNIGAPGQYIMATVGSLFTALSIQTTTRAQGVLVWILALVVGMICGALWGVIPGFLKAFFNINEVIICIMTNWIAANIASWFFTYRVALHSTENTKGAYLAKIVNNYTPKFGFDKIFPGSYIDGGIIFAIIIAIIVFIVMNRTTFGYELKACGSNKNASKYAGLNEKRNIIISMAIAGGLAGLGACFYYLNPGIEYNYVSQYSSLPAYGFNGIASSFLASCNPIGTVVSSLFIRYINMGGESLVKIGLNRYVSDIIISIIIYTAGFTMIIKELLSKIGKKEKKNMNNKTTENNEKETEIADAETKEETKMEGVTE